MKRNNAIFSAHVKHNEKSPRDEVMTISQGYELFAGDVLTFKFASHSDVSDWRIAIEQVTDEANDGSTHLARFFTEGANYRVLETATYQFVVPNPWANDTLSLGIISVYRQQLQQQQEPGQVRFPT